MPRFAPHAAIERYERIASRHGLALRVVSYTERETAGYLRLPRAVRMLLDPWRLRRTLRRAEERETLLLRDFLTLPFAAALPALLRWRRRLLLVVNHNLQSAHRSRAQRAALRSIAGAGFRFVALESGAGWREVGIDPGAVTVLPLAAPPADPALAAAPRSRCVGIVGMPRTEKGSATALADLRAAASRLDGGPIGILVGRPGARERTPEESAAEVELVDTTTRESYESALARCAVVYLPYSRESYEYRCSATALDAVLAGAVALCPELPVLSEQVRTPVEVGVTYRDASELAAALRRALDLSAADRDRFALYAAHRGGHALAERLDGLARRVG
jgi:hypothetical protein